MKFKLNNSKEELEFSKELIEKWVFEKKAQNTELLRVLILGTPKSARR
jgi:hypothetical protein